MSKRIIFTFSDQAAEQLEALREECQLKSLAEVVRRAVELMATLNTHSARGYSQLVLRNPKSGREREVVLPSWSERV